MKKELNYFTIDGELGWNQSRFRDPMMYFGGCAAVTACDLCVWMAREKGIERVYPFQSDPVEREEYRSFSKRMKPYLRPRFSGIDSLEIYLDGISKFWREIGESRLYAEGLHGSMPFEEAKRMVLEQIDAEILVPCLLLHHKNGAFSNLQWHWFNLAGYKEMNGEFYVKAVTYGHSRWLKLRELWDTGYEKKGGLIRVTVR